MSTDTHAGMRTGERAREDQGRNLAEASPAGEVGRFHASCQQCYYSVLNFDVLLGLLARRLRHAC